MLEEMIRLVFEELLVRYGRGVRPREEFSLDDVPGKWGSDDDEEDEEVEEQEKQEKQDPMGSHQDTEACVSSLGEAMNGMAMDDGSDNGGDDGGDDGGRVEDDGEDGDVVMT
jgi:hypothetical protein